MRILVTGGAGFIGSALCRHLLRTGTDTVVNVDGLTYAGHPDSVAEIARDPRYAFEQADIGDVEAMAWIFRRHRPDAVIHLAAETHVDRSIDGPDAFVQTNIIGTYTLLETARRYWEALDEHRQAAFRFLHVSTDEVYGSLGPDGRFHEDTPYAPSSPYSASKAASDHLARAWHHTFGLPVIVSNCSNNYGPRQYPEKLIPLIILNALEGRPLPVYGSGGNVRDWLYVEDHARALDRILRAGRAGEKYNVGGGDERTNLEVVRTLCALLDERAPPADGVPRERLITFVPDRPSHDWRYAIDAAKVRGELGWTPQVAFEDGLRRTIDWYLANPRWWGRIRGGLYQGERLGLGDGRRVRGGVRR